MPYASKYRYRNASPLIEYHDRIAVPGGKERDILALAFPAVSLRRNLEVLSGRFFDDADTQARNKVAVITQKLAATLYGSPDLAVGQQISSADFPSPSSERFASASIRSDRPKFPTTPSSFLTRLRATSPTAPGEAAFLLGIGFGEVPRATQQILEVLQSRHRPESIYHVDNLTQLLQVASQTANTLTTVLLLISVLTLM